MKYFILCLVLLMFSMLAGCTGYYQSKQAYYGLQAKAIEAQSKQNNDLLKLELDDAGKIKSIVMGNPYLKTISPKESVSPAYQLVSDIVRSPVMSIIGGGIAASMIAREAGDRISNSGNNGSYNSSSGSMAVAETGGAKFDSSTHDDHSVNDSGNDSSNKPIDNSVTTKNSHNPVDNSVATVDDHSLQDSGNDFSSKPIDNSINTNDSNNPVDNSATEHDTNKPVDNSVIEHDNNNPVDNSVIEHDTNNPIDNSTTDSNNPIDNHDDNSIELDDHEINYSNTVEPTDTDIVP